MHLTELGLEQKDVNALKKKHVHTADDLVRRFPRLYRDYRDIVDPAFCRDGEYQAVGGVMNGAEVKDGAKMKYLRLNFSAGETRFRADFFVGRASYYIRKQYEQYLGMQVVVTGKVSVHPVYGISIANAEVFTAFEFRPGIYPVYPKNGKMKEETFRLWLEKCLEMQGEILEKEIRGKYGLDTYRNTLLKMHHPGSMKELEEAQRQIAFYDLLWFELQRAELESGKPDTTQIVMRTTGVMKDFLGRLPFKMTQMTEEEKEASDGTSGGQADILNVLVQKAFYGKRVEAVIEGDVGCGKTAVAGAMAIYAASNGYQAVVIAPKTVLARQHAKEIASWCEMMGITCGSVIGTPKSAVERKERKELLKKIREGEISVVVGTHACFGKDVVYKNAGLLIIDEEQQFGVEQKAALREKALPDAHYIEMSATPVPRSLALSIYGNREILRITKKPSGRQRIQTASCVADPPAMRFMEKQLALGRQCYVVVPMIDENEEDSIDGVEKTAKRYSDYFSPLGYKVTTADGRMKEEDFEKSITSFKNNESQILISTTVVEVGVNVPNATVMVVENAERFGLSQMHQLRGRVGRREYKSYCVLVTQDTANERIRVMTNTDDGFAIAEQDLLLRGPGDVNGVKQSGQDKYIAEALIYPDIHKKAREAAAMCTEENRYGTFLKITYNEHKKYDEK